MTTADYRKPRTAYKPSHGQVNTSINAPSISYDEVQVLVVHLDEIGDVHLVKASLRVSRYVFSVLMDLCDGSMKAVKIRGQLLRDTALDIEQDLTLPIERRTFWFYVLNELVRAGVVLPVVEREEVAA